MGMMCKIDLRENGHGEDKVNRIESIEELVDGFQDNVGKYRADTFQSHFLILFLLINR